MLSLQGELHHGRPPNNSGNHRVISHGSAVGVLDAKSASCTEHNQEPLINLSMLRSNHHNERASLPLLGRDICLNGKLNTRRITLRRSRASAAARPICYVGPRSRAATPKAVYSTA